MKKMMFMTNCLLKLEILKRFNVNYLISENRKGVIELFAFDVLCNVAGWGFGWVGG